MIHGTFTGYTNGKCRCQACTVANRLHQQDRRQQEGRNPRYLTPEEREERRHCLICGVALNVHPIRTCWREVR